MWHLGSIMMPTLSEHRGETNAIKPERPLAQASITTRQVLHLGSMPMPALRVVSSPSRRPSGTLPSPYLKGAM